MSERWPGHPAKLDEPEGTAVDEVEEGAVSSDGAAEEQELPQLRTPDEQHASGELDIPDDVNVIEGEPDGTRRGVAIVASRFNGEITDKLLRSALAALDEAGVRREAVTVMPVPGAFELPLVASYAARSGRYAAIVCLGAVIRGETDHYAHVCGEAARGIQQVQLETGVPCGFGVLTVDTMEQALDRVSGGAKRDTGRHAAEAALAALAVKQQLAAPRKAAGFS